MEHGAGNSRQDGSSASAPPPPDELLARAGSAGALEDGANRTKTGEPVEGDCEQCDTDSETLVDSLRQAFEFHAAALAAPQTCWLGRTGGSSAAFSGVESAPPLPGGLRLGEFEIIDELGRGGMGVVYRARQLSLGREVALKVLPAYARYGQVAVRRFLTEARAASRLHHSNIVPIYAQGEHQGQFYYTMELIQGASLDRLIHSRELDKDWRRLAVMVAEVAEALDYAHRQGVVHRDVKPHNLLLGRDNRLYLTDFGLAYLSEEPHATASGELVGTPAYLSPEQVRGNPAEIDQRTDVYSLGVTLYELITGCKPFRGQTREQIIIEINEAEPQRPRRLEAGIPVELETVCLRAMEKDAGRRYATAGLMAADLRRFAEGRRILARRPGHLTRTVRWIRRRRVLSLAVACAIIIVILGLGWAGTARLARQREAQRLVDRAYGQLVYDDFYGTDTVAADLARATALGGKQPELHLALALLSMGKFDEVGAMQHLSRCLALAPADLRAQYMLAWAYASAGKSVEARDAFNQAEAGGPPETADASFLRGLAIHYVDPPRAIEAYREATALRVREHGFFPQAMLNLARARNQQLYATRSLDSFSEAVASLEQLVAHGYYKSHPHYLLSIAHRLAAEVYSGSSGTRDDSLVLQHYEQALEWALHGQEVEPESDRPITAEAECLESMGRLAEAEQARTRAIAVAAKERFRWEGRHYRWRLRYWLNDFDGAMSDLAICHEYDPESPFYEHIYPALVMAETGDLEGAAARMRAVAEACPQAALNVLWAATGLRLLGQPETARQVLDEQAAANLDFASGLVLPQSEEWVRGLYDFCRGAAGEGELEALASGVAAPWRLRGELWFHLAALELADGDRAKALSALRRAYRSFDSETRYTYHARLLCVKMESDPAWPAWMGGQAATAPEAPSPAGSGE